MSHSVGQHLRLDIRDYDRLIRTFIPGYEAMLDHAAAAVATVAPLRGLDLGAGTGALSERVLEQTAATVVELWDVDPEMLGVAHERLARFGDRCQYLHRAFQEPFPACDAVMASLALHHIRDLADKTRLYRRACDSLGAGGVLVNADITMPTDEGLRQATYRAWADHQVASGIAEDQAWAHFEAWSGEDRYFSVEEELAALTAAGFQSTCAWRLGPATVTVGTKPR